MSPRADIDRLLRERHGANSRAQLRGPDETGAFPPAFLGRPRAIVADTTYVCQDVAYACRHENRTALITLANEGLVRIFCAEHVTAEVVEKRELRSPNATAQVSDVDFIARWEGEYLPHIRLVPDEAIPDGWLAPVELARLDALRQSRRRGARTRGKARRAALRGSCLEGRLLSRGSSPPLRAPSASPAVNEADGLDFDMKSRWRPRAMGAGRRPSPAHAR